MTLSKENPALVYNKDYIRLTHSFAIFAHISTIGVLKKNNNFYTFTIMPKIILVYTIFVVVYETQTS